MNFTLHQLQVFLKVVETGSVTKAANELHLTQPAVSIQLRNLQAHFDVPLVEVIGRKIFVTQFGKEVAASARAIMQETEALNGKLHAFKGQLYGKLKISVVSTGKYVIPYFVTGFVQKHHGVEVSIDVTNRSQVIQSLENNEVDFSLVSLPPDTLAVERMNLLQNKLFLIGGTKGEFKKEYHDKKLLAQLPLIFREKGSGTRALMEKFLRKLNVSVVRKMELTSNEAVKQAVLAGLGYSIMPLIGLRNELLNKQLQVIPVKGLPVKTMWQLVWLKGKKHSPVARAFLNYLHSEKNNIINNNFSWFERFE